MAVYLPEFRLEKAKKRSLLSRHLARISAGVLTSTFAVLHGVAALGSIRQSRQERATAVFVGRFESKNWFDAHFGPLVKSGVFEKIVVIDSGDALPGYPVQWARPPRPLRRAFGEVGSKLIWTFVVARRESASVVGGFHLLCNGLTAIVVARWLKARSVYFSVGGWTELAGGGAYSGTRIFSDTGQKSDRLERRLVELASSATYVVAMGHRSKHRLQSHGVKNVLVCPGGIADTRFRKDVASTKDYDLIVVARLDAIKRIDRFIEICSLLLAEGVLRKAVVVGDGDESGFLRSLAHEKGLADVVDWIGFSANVDEWLMRSKIFVLTSDSEGLPLSLMEASCAGLPIVTANVGDVADLVDHGVSGFIVQPDDIPQYVSSIKEILTSDAKWTAMSMEARKRSSRFRVGAAVEVWKEAF